MREAWKGKGSTREGKRGHSLRSCRCARIRLPHGRLRAHEAEEDIPTAHDVDVVQDVMLDRETDEPRRPNLRRRRRCLKQQPPSRRDLRVARVSVEHAVRSPKPQILKVSAAATANVHHHKSRLAQGAVLLDGGPRAGRSSDTHHAVPHGHGALEGRLHVDLDEDRAGENVARFEEHVADLDEPHVPRSAHLDDRARVVFVFELASACWSS